MAHTADEAELGRVEPHLRVIAAEAGLASIEDLDALRLAERVERRLEEAAAAFAASRDREARFAEAERRLGSARDDEESAQNALAEWRERWLSAIPVLRLGAEPSIQAAEAALAIWSQAQNDADNRRNRMDRVKGMKRDMERFEAETATLVCRCAPDAANLPADAAARRLNQGLAAARKAETRRQGPREHSRPRGGRSPRCKREPPKPQSCWRRSLRACRPGPIRPRFSRAPASARRS